MRRVLPAGAAAGLAARRRPGAAAARSRCRRPGGGAASPPGAAPRSCAGPPPVRGAAPRRAARACCPRALRRRLAAPRPAALTRSTPWVARAARRRGPRAGGDGRSAAARASPPRRARSRRAGAGGGHAGARAGHRRARRGRRAAGAPARAAPPTGAARLAARRSAQEDRERQPGGELAGHAAAQRQRDVEAGTRAASRRHGWQWETWRARRRWSRTPEVRVAGVGDDALDAQAARAGRELVVLLAEPLARAEQRALHGGAAHAHALADVLVAAALELAHDEDLVVRLGQAAERAAQQVEVLLGVHGRLRARRGRREAPVVGGGEAVVGVEGDLLGAPPAAVRVDAGVLGDLVDPGLEGDRALGLAHPPQRGDEHLLGDVLRAAVVLDHAVAVRGDPALIARVEDLEGAIVAAAHRAHQLVVRRAVLPVRSSTGADGIPIASTVSPASP